MFKSSTGGGTAFAGIEKKLSGGAPDEPGLPATMRKAVRFMLAGAAITVVFGVFMLIVAIANKNSIDVKTGKPLSSSGVTEDVVGTVVSYIVYALLWLLMARFNRAGQKWARIVASVLFGISTLQLYEIVSSLNGGTIINGAVIVFLLLTIALWAVGAGAIAMLWRSTSSAYFQAQSIKRQ